MLRILDTLNGPDPANEKPAAKALDLAQFHPHESCNAPLGCHSVSHVKPMPQAPNSTPCADLSPTRRWGLYTWALLMGLLAWDFAGLDLPAMHLLADARGFDLRQSTAMETVWHTGARRLAIGIYLGLLAMVWWPRGPFRRLSRLQRVEIVVGTALGLILISSLKSISLTSCPWDLQDFGGVARYVSHWQWGVTDGGGGRCFPGGHASSALAFLALSLPWLTSGDKAQQQTGRRVLAFVVLAGLLLGLSQTLRGAHYPSHTFWTGFICWAVALCNHMAFGWLAHRRREPTL